MKKTLFVKFLFLLLCGSVLTTAGCKDYDDDIDALRNDVEDLKGKDNQTSINHIIYSASTIFSLRKKGRGCCFLKNNGI